MARASNPARRQHFIARFYLRNFAAPLFSDNLWVFDLRRRRWEKRTPDGVGWFPHLCSAIRTDGTRTDAFDRFLKLNVEDPAAPAMKKLATGGSLNAVERAAVALFIALTAARSPGLWRVVQREHMDELAQAERSALDTSVQAWCKLAARPYDDDAHVEFLKPSRFSAIWNWSQSLQHRLIGWQWHLVHTSRDLPFVTSDRPVVLHWDQTQQVRLATFPISSEVALVIFSAGLLNAARDRSAETRAINRATMDRATEFVVACQPSFPCDERLRPGA